MKNKVISWKNKKNIVPLQSKTKIEEGLMKTKNEILHLLSQYKPMAMSKYGLTRIGIFGSVARDEQTETSDVDVCYEGKAPSLLTLDVIQTELEKLFGCPVDIVRVREDMNRLLRQRIQKEGIYV